MNLIKPSLLSLTRNWWVHQLTNHLSICRMKWQPSVSQSVMVASSSTALPVRCLSCFSPASSTFSKSEHSVSSGTLIGWQPVRLKARGNEYQPSVRKRLTKHGYHKRMKTLGGIEVLWRRMLKGRTLLVHGNFNRKPSKGVWWRLKKTFLLTLDNKLSLNIMWSHIYEVVAFLATWRTKWNKQAGELILAFYSSADSFPIWRNLWK